MNNNSPNDTRPDVAARQLANAATLAADAATERPRMLAAFEAMDEAVTVIRDDDAADVVLHERSVTVHVRW